MPFVEDPWSRVVAVHFEDEPEPPPVDLGPPYCGQYGYGARSENYLGMVISAVPYGPNQLPPMAGTFPAYNNIGPGGERYGGLTGVPMHPIETITAAPYGLIVTGIQLGPSDILFSNQQLLSMQDIFGDVATLGWVVPMAGGQQPVTGIPIVIKSYTISVEWETGFDPSDGEVGIGITRLAPIHFGAVPQPPEPAVVLGNLASGSGSFFYDFKYAAWHSGLFPVNSDNQFDHELGGLAQLWWMTRGRFGTEFGGWRASAQFCESVMIGLGDHYTWEIVAECQTQPPPLITP